MNNSMKIGLVKVTLFSILIALSGMAAIASADEEMPIVNIFYGNVTLNGADAPLETVVDAYIEEEFSGSSENEVGSYYMGVVGNESDDGKTITFTVCGATADQTAVWYASYQSQLLNLTAVDDEAPAVTDANANPASIVNGTDMTQLNVTVIDGCRCTVGNVTVNLSAIGGDAAQVMTRIEGTDVYSVITNATEGTALGAYCLQVNASDVFGKCNTSVYIALDVVDELPKTGDINGNDAVTLADAIYLAKHVAKMSGYETLYADGDINGNDAVTLADAIYLAKHVAKMSGYETLY